MKLSLIKSLARLLLICALASPDPTSADIGYKTVTFQGNSNTRPFSLSIWYPALATRIPREIAGNAVFLGREAMRNAPVLEGSYPVVIVAHGGLRSAANTGSWLSARLAEAGFIAVEANTLRPINAKEAVDEIWQRPQDLSRVLDLFLTDPDWAAATDQSRISILGFALGGTSALMLTGGMINGQAFAQSCKGKTPGPDCSWFASQGVTLDGVDQNALKKSFRDSRITSAIAINPEYLKVFSDDSFQKNKLRQSLIWLGSGEEAGDTTLPHASPFDAFPVCTKRGLEILTEAGADRELCMSDPAARGRIHDDITRKVVEILTTERD